MNEKERKKRKKERKEGRKKEKGKKKRLERLMIIPPGFLLKDPNPPRHWAFKTVSSLRAHHLLDVFEWKRYSLLHSHLHSEEACCLRRASKPCSCYPSTNILAQDRCARTFPERCSEEMEFSTKSSLISVRVTLIDQRFVAVCEGEAWMRIQESRKLLKRFMQIIFLDGRDKGVN